MSITFIMNDIIMIKNKGIDNILYEIAVLKSNESIAMKALVIPHAGHGKWKIFLNTQDMLNLV